MDSCCLVKTTRDNNKPRLERHHLGLLAWRLSVVGQANGLLCSSYMSSHALPCRYIPGQLLNGDDGAAQPYFGPLYHLLLLLLVRTTRRTPSAREGPAVLARLRSPLPCLSCLSSRGTCEGRLQGGRARTRWREMRSGLGIIFISSKAYDHLPRKAATQRVAIICTLAISDKSL